MPEESIFVFPTSVEAGLFIQERLHEGDVVLIKGSQGARMEKITKELMADPLRAKELLVRAIRGMVVGARFPRPGRGNPAPTYKKQGPFV